MRLLCALSTLLAACSAPARPGAPDAGGLGPDAAPDAGEPGPGPCEEPSACDDGDACTADSCDADGCLHTPIEGCGAPVACEDHDAWRPTALAGAPPGRYWQGAVWTGEEMMVWGGVGVGYDYINSGGLYDPVTDTWRPTSTVGAPSGRLDMVMVWTGREVVIWSGRRNAGGLHDGGRYDPATDTWKPMSTVGAPPATDEPEGIWSGSEMIVWGDDAVTGGRYDPETDSWTAMTTAGSPVPRDEHVMVWDGERALVWGGRACGGGMCPYVNTGGRYDPAGDMWSAMTTVGAAPPAAWGTGVWSGGELLVFGGRTCGFVDGCEVGTGGRYDPAADSWKPMTTVGAPAPRHTHVAAWTGDKMIVWGGGAALRNDGAIYDPATDGWAPMAQVGAPAGRRIFTGVWTGAELIVWGGIATTGEFGQDGGVYCP